MSVEGGFKVALLANSSNCKASLLSLLVEGNGKVFLKSLLTLEWSCLFVSNLDKDKIHITALLRAEM